MFMVRQISPQVARSTIISAIEQVGKEIKLAGWVERVRSHGKISFFDLRDRSGTIQIAAFDEEAAQVSSLSVQDVVEIEGEVKARDEKYINPEIETGSVEIRLKKLKVIS